MKNIKLILLAVPLLLILWGFKSGNEKTVYKSGFFSSKNLVVGEELTYVVSYAFVKLGEIRLEVTGKEIRKGKVYYKTIAYMDSYSGIPFVNLHMIYESTLTPDFYSFFFRGLVKKDEYTTFTDYFFRYDSSLVRIMKGKLEPYQLWTDSTAAVNKEFQDGLSILYYARMNSGSSFSIDLPCFVNEKKEYTKINFYNKAEPVDVDGIDYPVSAVRLDGEMNFISIFGLTGHFEGWFSNDNAGIPLIAKLKVILGNVKVELKSWKRTGWKPPKFTED